MSKRSTRKSKSIPPVAPIAAAPVAVAPVVAAQPSHEDIARRAYELYLARGASRGCEFQDWIAAERELATRAA